MDNSFQGRLGTIDSVQFLFGSLMDSLKRVECALAIVGLYYTTKLILTYSGALLKAGRIYIFEPLFGRKRNFVKEYGKWAVVTGSTDGIGLEFAKQLAKEGMNIVLISRSLEKLVKVAGDISTEYKVQTKVIAVDFSGDFSIYRKIEQELDTIEIGILVNNVGVFPPYPMPVGEQDSVDLWKQVTVNVGAVTLMTKLVIPKMAQRGRGGIINLSSGAGIEPIPLIAAYSASKVYVNYFSDALRREYKKFGITVQCLTPFYISTNMTNFSDRMVKPSFFIPNSKGYVASALSTFGISDSCMGYLPHAIQYGGLNIIPRSWYRWYSHYYQKVLRVEAKKKGK